MPLTCFDNLLSWSHLNVNCLEGHGQFLGTMCQSGGSCHLGMSFYFQIEAQTERTRALDNRSGMTVCSPIFHGWQHGSIASVSVGISTFCHICTSHCHHDCKDGRMRLYAQR